MQLTAAGLPVTFIEADGDKIAWGRVHGVQVDNRPPKPADFLPFDDWSPDPGATVLLCTKCYHNSAVLGRLPAGVDLIPIQNGFDPAPGKRTTRRGGDRLVCLGMPAGAEPNAHHPCRPAAFRRPGGRAVIPAVPK